MGYRIGFPRALLYHYYYPAWKEFFEEIGLEVVLSPETNKKILDQGVKLAVDDLCLPFKVYYGHVQELCLCSNKVDYIFVPRLVSLGKDNCVCPKFMGLPDMVRATFSKIPKLLEPVIDLRKKFFPERSIFYQIGRKFNVGWWQIEKALRKARKKQKEFEELQQKGYTTSASMEKAIDEKHHKRGNDNKNEEPDKRFDKEDLTIAVIGHTYIVNDDYLSMGIVKQLQEMGIKVITHEMIEEDVREEEAQKQSKGSFWIFNRQIMGAAYHLLSQARDKVDGLIQVTAFGCGPDSMIGELINLKVKEREGSFLLNIIIDEHTGKAGLITRLEAFTDLIRRQD